MLKVKYTFHDRILNITKCPSTFKEIHFQKILKEIGNNSIIESVILPEGVEKLGERVFFCQGNIISINLPSTLKHISEDAFNHCSRLKRITIPERVETINSHAFSNSGIEEIILPPNIKVISWGTFENCEKLKNIKIPEGVAYISDSAFKYSGIQNISMPSTLNSIGDNAFYGCYGLKSITIPENVTFIGDCVFYDCIHLKNIELNEGLESIGSRCFVGITAKMRDDTIRLPSTLTYIDEQAFRGCDSIKYLTIPEGVKIIKEQTFSSCSIKKIKLPSTLEKIEDYAFSDANDLTSIEIPKNVKSIGENVFNCLTLEELIVPETITLKSAMFEDGAYYGKLKIRKEDGSLVDFKHCVYFIENSEKCIFASGDEDMYSFYYNGDYGEFNEEQLLEKTNEVNEIDCINTCDYIKLWYWVKKNKFLPNYKVIENMPIKDIDLFYINGNCKKWKKLLEDYDVQTREGLATLFKVSYVLGLFNKEGSKSDRAYNYIRENILNKFNEEELHARYDGFDTSKGYDEMYAEFFMKYFKENPDFMVHNDIDLIAAAYNNFNVIKQIYPNKIVNTNRNADILLPSHVFSVIENRSYDDIDDDNALFALEVSKYGYSQEQFEELQDWFNKGKKIKQEDIKLFIEEDKEDKSKVTYKLLEKDNPLGAVVGNITNCCQVIGGAGESCVKYGMCEPNSKFMVFNHKNNIIGQAWVWYDESTKTVCLDNIEIPRSYLSIIKKFKLKKGFVDCLKRVASNFISEMEKHGLEVNKVTVGEGYNDIKKVLSNSFNKDKSPATLSKYYGYTDADKQFIIGKKK